MVVLFFGPPGCGKGTQSRYVARRLKIPAISTGEMLRAECEADSALGRIARTLLANGELVGDGLVNAMVRNRLSKSDCRSGFILDGYPRTIPQAQWLDRFIQEHGHTHPFVVHLQVSSEVLVSRVSGRRHCPKCSRVYNLVSQRPRFEGKCDVDGASLVRRADDAAEVVIARMRAYNELCEPLIEYYGRANYHGIDGHRPPEEVSREILEILSPAPVRMRSGRRFAAR